MLGLVLAAVVAGAGPSEADQRLADMTALYEQLCLRAFPDDKAVEARMKAEGARELTPDEVRVTMGNDPARGWALTGGGASVWIELPPFHACTVRWNTPEVGDLGVYRQAADAYERPLGGFRPITPIDRDRGAIHVHAFGEQRVLQGQGAESLMVIDQHIGDPRRREAGETGVSLRFVHQFAPPPPNPSK